MDIWVTSYNRSKLEESTTTNTWYPRLYTNAWLSSLLSSKRHPTASRSNNQTLGTIFESPNASTQRPDASDSCRTPGAPRAPPAFRRHSATFRLRAGGVPGRRVTSGRRRSRARVHNCQFAFAGVPGVRRPKGKLTWFLMNTIFGTPLFHLKVKTWSLPRCLWSA